MKASMATISSRAAPPAPSSSSRSLVAPIAAGPWLPMGKHGFLLQLACPDLGRAIAALPAPPTPTCVAFVPPALQSSQRQPPGLPDTGRALAWVHPAPCCEPYTASAPCTLLRRLLEVAAGAGGRGTSWTRTPWERAGGGRGCGGAASVWEGRVWGGGLLAVLASSRQVAVGAMGPLEEDGLAATDDAKLGKACQGGKAWQYAWLLPRHLVGKGLPSPLVPLASPHPQLPCFQWEQEGAGGVGGTGGRSVPGPWGCSLSPRGQQQAAAGLQAALPTSFHMHLLASSPPPPPGLAPEPAAGYGSEAISYVAQLLLSGLVAPEDLWLTQGECDECDGQAWCEPCEPSAKALGLWVQGQAGDSWSGTVVESMDPGLRALLLAQDYPTITRRLSAADRDRPLIVICHTFPNNWRRPGSAAGHTSWSLRGAVNWVGDGLKYGLLGWQREQDPPGDGLCPPALLKVSRAAARPGQASGATGERRGGAGLPAGLGGAGAVLGERVVYTAGRTMFETASLPHDLLPYTNAVDESCFVWSDRHEGEGWHVGGLVQCEGRGVEGVRVVVPSPWNAASFKGSGVKPPFGIHVLPQWEGRKGWDLLLTAFFQEFGPQESVELHVVTHLPGGPQTGQPSIEDRVLAAVHQRLEQLPRMYTYTHHIPDAL
ncbi:hypothetical protein V8C86DRAFT_3203947, partial [Haematococcus lacustris]